MRCHYLHITAWQVIFIILYTTIDNVARRKKVAPYVPNASCLRLAFPFAEIPNRQQIPEFSTFRKIKFLQRGFQTILHCFG